MCVYAPFVWVVPVIMVTALIVLWTEIGASALVGFFLVIIIMALQMKVGKRIGQNRRSMLKVSDHRVKFMNEILQGIRVIKLYSWEISVCEEINRMRKLELSHVRRINILKALNMVIVFMWPAIATFCVVSVFVYIGNALTVGSFFLILNFLNVLRYPSVVFSLGVNCLIEGIVSLERLSKYLSLQEVHASKKCLSENDIDIQEADFGWDEEEKSAVLKSISLHVKRGSLIAVIGKVGSGKSSLLSAILGEMPCLKGICSSSSSIGYMAQSSWIRNASLRDNILCGQNYDMKLYDEIIRATALVEDFKVLQKGDFTEIGERGINLSGGQKSRVSLARLAYRHKLMDTVLLDDPFAALDVSVGEHIFSNCIQRVLREKTRIIAMNSHLHLLKHFDRIIVLGEKSLESSVEKDGNTIIFEGEFDEFTKAFPDVLSDQASSGSISDNKEYILSGDLSQEQDYSKKNSMGLISAEDRVEGLVRWRTYLTYFQFGSPKLGIFFLVFIIFMYSFAQGFRIICDVWAAAWSNGSYFGQRSTEFWCGIYAILIAGTLLVSSVRSFLFVELSVRSSISLHDSMFQSLMMAPITTFFGN
jgi:ATP-binding cassette subfamily C (CFTR/MRP) protein 1